MSEMAKILGAYGAGHTLTHKGKDYVFPALSWGKKDALTKAYYKHQRDLLREDRDVLSEEEYAEKQDALRRQYEDGLFDFAGGDGRVSKFYFGKGMPLCLSVLLGCSLEEAHEIATEHILEVQHIVLCLLAESAPDESKKKLESLPPEQEKEFLAVWSQLQTALAGSATR